jgi:hypothetical protein
MTWLWTPSTTGEAIECLSKVLDGTPVACGSRNFAQNEIETWLPEKR